jgi:hypothetical protein
MEQLLHKRTSPQAGQAAAAIDTCIATIVGVH